MGYTVFPDGPYGEATEAVYNEINRSITKHPKNVPFHSTHEGYGILKEEVDELWEAIKNDDPEYAAYEAIHVAAMAIRFAAYFGKYPYSKPTATFGTFTLPELTKKLLKNEQ